MAKDNGIIGAVEKRELAKIIEIEFNTIITNMQTEMKYTEGEILEQAQKKFGIKYIDNEIKSLENKIEMLKKQKEKLGFTSGHCAGFITEGYGQEVDPRTKAGRFFYLKMARNIDVQNLKDQKNGRLKELWLTDQRSEVKELANRKPDIKLLEKPKEK